MATPLSAPATLSAVVRGGRKMPSIWKSILPAEPGCVVASTVVLTETAGSLDSSMIFAGVDGRLKATVAAPDDAAASLRAWRSEPAPLSFVFVTVKTAAFAHLIPPGPGVYRPAAGTHATEAPFGFFWAECACNACGRPLFRRPSKAEHSPAAHLQLISGHLPPRVLESRTAAAPSADTCRCSRLPTCDWRGRGSPAPSRRWRCGRPARCGRAGTRRSSALR